MTPASKSTQVKRVSASRAGSSATRGKKSASSKVGASTTKSSVLSKKKAVPVVKKAPSTIKKATPSAKKAPVATKKAPAAKKAGAAVKKAAPAKKAPAATAKKASTTAKKAPAEKAPAKKAPAEKAPAKKATAVGNGAAPVVAVAPRTTFTPKPKPPAPVRPKSGPYSKDLKFLDEVRELLNDERAIYQEQATSLRAEADSLALEREPGDVQFDEESGEGGTVTVDRERNLALSGQASIAVEEIDDALVRIVDKTYGYCERCYQPIPKPRLRALPYARLCVACKSGGLSRR
jgi:RNA polymerase-binding transcription factor DksA